MKKTKFCISLLIAICLFVMYILAITESISNPRKKRAEIVPVLAHAIPMGHRIDREDINLEIVFTDSLSDSLLSHFVVGKYARRDLKIHEALTNRTICAVRMISQTEIIIPIKVEPIYAGSIVPGNQIRISVGGKIFPRKKSYLVVSDIILTETSAVLLASLNREDFESEMLSSLVDSLAIPIVYH